MARITSIHLFTDKPNLINQRGCGTASGTCDVCNGNAWEGDKQIIQLLTWVIEKGYELNIDHSHKGETVITFPRDFEL